MFVHFRTRLPRENRPNRYDSRCKVTTDDFRILIAATEKTGNTWLKLLLSQIYDLPTPYISQDFSEAEADSLGNRWVTHQHFLPERPLLTWATATQTHLLTMIRHPADALVSLYHYCCNYADHYKDDDAITRALATDASQRQATADLAHHVVDGELIRTLQDRIMCDLNISISWMHSGRSILVRYEHLRAEPLTTLSQLAASIMPVSRDRIERAIDGCDIEILRDSYAIDRRFFRRALIGEWRTALPAEILRRFAEEEPFRSQLAFLGYQVELDEIGPQPVARGQTPNQSPGECFDNGVPFVPILTELLQSAAPEKRASWNPVLDTSSPDCFFHWANASVEEDPFVREAVPRITNLAAFIHKQRPDLQTAFPDIFDLNRLGYASWFLRYAAQRYQLDRSFLTPVALSWISKPGGREHSLHQQVISI
jgi:Sulfotransferase domain